MSEERAARDLVEGAFGRSFAEKATEALCGYLARRSSAASEGIAEEARAIGSVVVSFATGVNELGKAGALLAQELGYLGQLDKELEGGLEATSGPRLTVTGRMLLRYKLIAELRDAFQRATAPIRDQIERSTGALASTRAEPQDASMITDACWLSRSMRARTAPGVLAEIAGDARVERFDLPRRLQPDLAVSSQTVGAARLRARQNCTGRGVVVAVIDSEIARSHPAFQDRIVLQRNYTNETWGNPGPHGTAVAGIIAGRPGDTAHWGMAPEATVYNYKVLASSSLLNGDNFGGALAIQHALEDGAVVANCSWGAGAAGDGTSPEARACEGAWQLGMAVVKSAGNRGPQSATLTTPADAEGVICVGATDRGGRALQSYSSRGPTPHGLARPHLLAPGGTPEEGITSCLVGGGLGDVGHGTSYAAPHVTGIAALLLQHEPNLQPVALRARLIAASRPLPGVPPADQGAGVLVF